MPCLVVVSNTRFPRCLDVHFPVLDQDHVLYPETYYKNRRHGQRRMFKSRTRIPFIPYSWYDEASKHFAGPFTANRKSRKCVTVVKTLSRSFEVEMSKEWGGYQASEGMRLMCGACRRSAPAAFAHCLSLSKDLELQSTTPAAPHIPTHTSLSTTKRSRVDTLPPPDPSAPPSRRVNTCPRWTTMPRAAQSTCASCRYTARFVNSRGWQRANTVMCRPTTSAPSSSSRTSTSKPRTRCGE